MASRAEQLKRNKQGQEARERVKSGTYNTRQATTSTVNPRTEALRNYVAPATPTFTAPNTSEFLTSVGIDESKFGKSTVKPVQTTTTKSVSQPTSLGSGAITTPLTTKLFANTGDKKAQTAFKSQTGFSPDPKLTKSPRTQYQIEQENINKSNMPGIVKGIASVGNALTRGNPVGRFLSQATTVPGVSVNPVDSTGSKAADAVGGFLGRNVSPLLVPSGAPLGSGPMGAPYEAAGKLLNTNVGQKTVNALGNGLSKVPFVSKNMGQTLAKAGLTEGLAGTLQNPAQELLNDAGRTTKELATDSAIGGVAGFGLGMAGEGLTKLAGSTISKLFKKNGIPDAEIEELLFLPEGKGSTRMSAASERSSLSPNAEPITNPYTFKLPDAADTTRSRASNAAGGREGIKEIDSAINDLNTKYEQRVIDEYKHLKQSLTERGGVTQGQIQRDINGDVVGRTGRQSNNPLWYQEFQRTNNKIPNNKELYELARDRVDNGFMDEMGQVPSWKAENNYDETLRSYTDVLDNLKSSVREIDPALNVVDSPLVSSELKSLNPKPAKTRAQAIQEFKAKAEAAPTVEPVQSSNPYSTATEDIPDFLRRNNTTPEPNRVNAPEEMPLPKADVEEAGTMKQDWFSDLFGNQGVGIAAGGSKSKIRQGPLSTADQIVNSPLKQDINGIKDSVKANARAAYQNVVDRLDPLKKINADTYEAAMDSTRANNIGNTIIRDKFVTLEGKVVGESLNGVFKKVSRGQDKAFTDYITLRHAVTRVERGEAVYAKELGMTPAKIKERIEMYDKRYPDFSKSAKEYDGFNDNVLRVLGVDEGLLSPKMYNYLREQNPHHSSMRRQFSKSEKPGRSFIQKSTSSSFSGQKAPLKQVSPNGSVRDIVDPRRTLTETVGAWTNAAMRNRVMQNMAEAVYENPEAFKGVVEIVKKPDSTLDLDQVLKKGGVDDFVEALDQEFVSLFKTTKVDQDNVVRAMVGGEPVYMQVHDPEIVKTLIGMGPQASNILIDTLTTFSNATKRGATGLLAPMFAVKGATTDLVSSAIQAKNPAKQAAYTVYSIFSGIGDKFNIPGLKNLSEEYRRAGGEFSAAIKGDRKLNKNISEMTRYPLLSPQGVKKGVTKAITAPFKALEAVGDIAENAPRMAAYKLEMDRLGGQRTPQNVRQAMSEAREITTNFSRKGAISRDIEALVPYNNAAVQGTYRVLKAFKNNPVKTIGAIGALSVLPKMLEYAQFHDDPEYQNLPARERYRFLFVNKNENGTFTKIPMEPAYNSFGEIAIEALRKFKNDDPTAFKGSIDAIANAWLPPIVTGALQGVTQDGGAEKSIVGAINSTVAAPFVAVASNQSFTGAPIVSSALSDRSPQHQYDEKTSGIAKKLGEVMNMSPVKVDYLIKSYGGDPARLLLPITSDVGQGNVKGSLLKNFIVDPAYTTTLTEDFYSAKDKLNQAYHDYTEADAPLPDWYNEDLRKAVNSSAKGSISKELSSLRDWKREVNADKSLNAKDKAKQMREIQTNINNIYIDINSVLNEAGIMNGK